MTDSEINALISKTIEGIPDVERRKAVAERLHGALRTAKRSARPDFPEEWRSEPNVMFNQSDPKPEPFDWGRPNWLTEEAYDEDLAKFIGAFACGPDAPEAQTLASTNRGLFTAWSERDRIWPKLFAQHLTGPNCPPARALPDDRRRWLEELAAGRDASAAAQKTSSPDSIE